MTRSTPSTCDEDFFTWTEEQAAALRRLPSGADVDIAHLADEIEDLGKRDLRELISYLTRLIEHLLKIEALPESRDRANWGRSRRTFSGRRKLPPRRACGA